MLSPTPLLFILFYFIVPYLYFSLVNINYSSLRTHVLFCANSNSRTTHDWTIYSLYCCINEDSNINYLGKKSQTISEFNNLT